MHKGSKCLDKSTGRIYISHDVVFDESIFPYATLVVSVDIPTLRQAITFSSTEPATHDHVCQYDLSYLSTNPPLQGDALPMQVPLADDSSAAPSATVAPSLSRRTSQAVFLPRQPVVMRPHLSSPSHLLLAILIPQPRLPRLLTPCLLLFMA
jgi:hypothetical protein